MAPTKPGHIQFHDKTLWDQMTARGGGKHSSHGLVAQMALARYVEICRRHTPTLTLGEWCALFDNLNGVWNLEPWSPTYTWANVADHEGLGEKWGIDQAALVQTLRDMPYAEAVAVVDAAERFWASDLQADERGWISVVEPIVGAEHIAP